MKTRQFSMLCAAAVVCMTAQPFCAVSAVSFTEGETDDRYCYSEFEDTYPGSEDTAQGTHKLTVGEQGCFTCEWDGIFNYRAEVGRKFKTDASFRNFSDVVFNYEMQINPRGNCWYGVHAKFENQPELYIVDGWGSWRPPGGQGFLGSGTANGKRYDYYQVTRYNQPGVEGTQLVTELWAVAATSSTRQNTTNRVKGEISISQHLRRLAELKSAYAAVYDSQLRCAALFAEGYGGGSGDSDCELTVTRNNLYLQPHPYPIPDPVPTGTDARFSADENGIFFRDGYESDTGNARKYGESAEIDMAAQYYADGAQSLQVFNRLEDWNCVSYPLDNFAVKPETPYCFQAAVMQEAENTASFEVVLQYTDEYGISQFQTLKTAAVRRGEWTVLTCKNFKVPSDGTENEYVKDTRIRIETPGYTDDYFVDCASLSEENVLPEISLADCVPPLPEETGGIAPPVPKDTPEYDPDGDGMKDLFGQYFRVGGIISDQYLKTDAAKDSVKKHFNSLSCKYGLDPLYTIKAVNGTDVTVDISRAASVLTFAEQNGIPVRGNSFFTIGTDQLLPEEMLLNTNAQECDARIESLMKNTFSELKFQHPNLKLYSYDVCTHVTGGSSEGGFYMPGRNQWSSIYGEGNDAYIVQAFKNARKYAPRITKLYLCDDQSWKMAEDAELEVLVKKIMQEGDYIDGVSLKAAVGRETDLTAYESWLKKLSALGMDIQFAEIGVHDVGDYSGAFMIQAWKQFLAMAADCADEISCVTLGKPAVTMPIFDEGPTTLFNINSETGELTPVRAFSEITDMMKARKDQTGDANCDGAVDVADAVLVMRYAVADREAVISEQGLKNADTDKNGNTDSDDATNILLHIAKKIDLTK